MKVTYSTNNSGGYWWLTDEDWHKLEDAGWKVRWVKNHPFYQKHGPTDRFLDALAMEATIDNVKDEQEAWEKWQELLSMDPFDEGCSCCGPPHSFYEAWNDDDE